MNEIWLKPKDVSEILNVSVRYIQKSINKYEHKVEYGNGGKTFYISLASLPESAKIEYYKRTGAYEPNKTKIIDMASRMPIKQENQPINEQNHPNELPDKYKELALCRFDAVKLWVNFRAESGLKKADADLEFIRKWDTKEYKYLYDILGSVSIKTLYRWLNALNESKNDYKSLAPNYKAEKGSTIEKVEEDVLLKFVKYPTKLKLAEIIRWTKQELNDKGYSYERSDITYRRWIEEWKSKNYDLWLLHREGEKALNDKCQFYIKRDHKAVNVGDILVLDGHTLNFEVTTPFPPYKQKRMTLITVNDFRSDMVLGWEIMLTENKYAIANAVRRALMFLGAAAGLQSTALKGRILQMDNGRANKSIYLLGKSDNKKSRWFNTDFNTLGFTGLFEKFFEGVQIAKPYHGQSKATVERFFGVFAELERMSLTYTGINIDSKPPRMSRNEKEHKVVFNAITQDNLLNIEQAHYMVMDWLGVYSDRKHQSGYWKGLSPIQVLNENIPTIKNLADFESRLIPFSELNVMMLEDKITTLHQRGVRFDGNDYFHPALYPLEKGKVNLKIKYDRLNKDSILVFDNDGNFICEAKKNDLIHPAAKWLGSGEDFENYQKQAKLQSELKHSSTTLYREHFKHVVKEIPASVQEMKERKEKNNKSVEEKSKKIEYDFTINSPVKTIELPDFGVAL